MSSLASFKGSSGGLLVSSAAAHAHSVSEATEQSLNPLFSSGGAASSSADPNATPEERESTMCSEAAHLRDVLLATNGPPSAALWAQVRSTCISTTGLLEQLVSERAAARKSDADREDEGNSGGGGSRGGGGGGGAVSAALSSSSRSNRPSASAASKRVMSASSPVSSSFAPVHVSANAAAAAAAGRQ